MSDEAPLTPGSAPSIFERRSLRQAVEAVTVRPRFVIENLIGATITLLYGQAEAGKGALSAGMAGALLRGETEFAGQRIASDVCRIVFMTSEADGTEEISGRLVETQDVPVDDPRVEIIEIGPIRSLSEWIWMGHNLGIGRGDLVFVDNLTQIAPGSINHDDVVNGVFAGLKHWTAKGASVVLIAHSSEKTDATYGSKDRHPLGSSAIRANSRHIVHVKRGANAVVTLTARNRRGIPLTITLKQESETSFRLLSSETERDRAQRDWQRDFEWAKWIIDNCQGLTCEQSAEKFAAQFDRKVSTFRSYVSGQGKHFGRFIEHDRRSNTWRWRNEAEAAA